MKSVSGNDGSYSLLVSFELGTNPDINTVNVNNRVQTALSKLPEDVQRQGVTSRSNLRRCSASSPSIRRNARMTSCSSPITRRSTSSTTSGAPPASATRSFSARRTTP